MRSGVCPGAMQLEIYQTGIGAHCPRLIKQEKAERTEYGCYSVTSASFCLHPTFLFRRNGKPLFGGFAKKPKEAGRLDVPRSRIGVHCPGLIEQEEAERTEYGCYSVTFVLGIPNALTF